MAIIEVEGSKVYQVDTTAMTCTCPNFKYRCSNFTIDRPERRCKHILQVMEDHPELFSSTESKAEVVTADSKDPDGKTRYARSVFDLYVTEIKKTVKSFDIVTDVQICGSYRRLAERCSDLDVLIQLKGSESWSPILDYFENILGYQLIKEIGRGDAKAAYMIDGFVHVDFKNVPMESWPYALMHFTGSKNTNIMMRRRANQIGYKLNEYGLFKESDDSRVEGLNTEEDVYNFLKLNYQQPWER